MWPHDGAIGCGQFWVLYDQAFPPVLSSLSDHTEDVLPFILHSLLLNSFYSISEVFLITLIKLAI